MTEPRETLRVLAIPRLMFLGLTIRGAWYASRRQSHHVLGTVIVDGAPAAIATSRATGAGSIGRGPPSRSRARRTRARSGSWTSSRIRSIFSLLTAVGGSVSFTGVVSGGKIDGAASFEDCAS